MLRTHERQTARACVFSTAVLTLMLPVGVAARVMRLAAGLTLDRFGFGFGLNYFDLDVESGDEDFRGSVDWSSRSAVLYFESSLGTGGRE